MKIEKLSQELVGWRVTCVIQDIVIQDAKLQYENGNYYIVQDFKDGSNCSDRLGYTYSWGVGGGSAASISNNEVEALELTKPSLKAGAVYKGLTLEHNTLSDKYVVEVYNDIIFYGPESNLLAGTCKALHELGYRVKEEAEVEAQEEMTLEQVCQELGRNIKIKPKP